MQQISLTRSFTWDGARAPHSPLHSSCLITHLASFVLTQMTIRGSSTCCPLRKHHFANVGASEWILQYGQIHEWVNRWMDALLSLRRKSAFSPHMETTENIDTGLSRTQNSKYNNKGGEAKCWNQTVKLTYWGNVWANMCRSTVHITDANSTVNVRVSV